MEVFWARGYEGATLTELQEAMGGITAPSFYAAFESKEALFGEAIELYSQTLGVPMMRGLEEEPTIRGALERLLIAAVDAFCKPGLPRGCMLVMAAINNTPANRGVQEYLRGLRARRQKAIRRRIERGVAEGEFPAGVDCSAMAVFVTTIVDGLSFQARDGASRRALRFAVHCAMAAWDQMVAAARV